MDRRLESVNINDVQNNPYQPDVTYRGFTASPLLGRQSDSRFIWMACASMKLWGYCKLGFRISHLNFLFVRSGANPPSVAHAKAGGGPADDEELPAHSKTLEDPRIKGLVTYPLPEPLLEARGGMMCGAGDFEKLSLFARRGLISFEASCLTPMASHPGILRWPAHRPFLGLPGVHSRCCLHTRAVANSRYAHRRLQPFCHLRD